MKANEAARSNNIPKRMQTLESNCPFGRTERQRNDKGAEVEKIKVREQIDGDTG